MRPLYKLKQKIKIEFQVIRIEDITKYRKNRKTNKMELVKLGHSYILAPLSTGIYSDDNHEFTIDIPEDL